jgi:hypothetical protein
MCFQPRVLIFYSSVDTCFFFQYEIDLPSFGFYEGVCKSVFGLDADRGISPSYGYREVVNVYLGTVASSCCECYLSRFDRV